MFFEVHLFAILCANVLGVKSHTLNGPDDPLILTPYVENGEAAKAKELSKVDPSLFAGVNSYAAYFTVNKTGDWNLFFWYFPVQGKPVESTPLIVTFNIYDVFHSYGPLSMTKRKKVEKRKHSWASRYSLLFISNPVGVGYSFSGSREFVSSLDMAAENLLNLMQQFLQVFPETAKASMFLYESGRGSSYALAFARIIHHNQNLTVPINLKGLILESAEIHPPAMLYNAEVLANIGLVSQEQTAQIKDAEEKSRASWYQGNMTAFKYNSEVATFLIWDFIRDVDLYNYVDTSHLRHIDFYYYYLNKPEVQAALHAKTMDYPNHQYEEALWALKGEEYKSYKPWLEEVLENYGVLCYTGQLDVMHAYPKAVRTYRSLKWSGAQGYLDADRIPFVDDFSRTANSYVRSSGNFMEAMIRSAGGLVANDKLRETSQLVDLFISMFK